MRLMKFIYSLFDDLIFEEFCHIGINYNNYKNFERRAIMITDSKRNFNILTADSNQLICQEKQTSRKIIYR